MLTFGAGNEARTRDLNLGKVALYQLSYSRITNLYPGSGAGNEARTRDLNLGKVALYQLSYSRIPDFFPEARSERLRIIKINLLLSTDYRSIFFAENSLAAILR